MHGGWRLGGHGGGSPRSFAPTSENNGQLLIRHCSRRSSNRPPRSPLRNDSLASRSPPLWVCSGLLSEVLVVSIPDNQHLDYRLRGLASENHPLRLTDL